MKLQNWVLARGCYWGVEARFGVIPGVVSTEVGMASGTLIESTSTGTEKPAEAVCITLNPEISPVSELLAVWHEDLPVELPAPDACYRAALFVQDHEQEEVARELIVTLQQAHCGREIHIDLLQLESFRPAQERHQKFLLRRFSHLLVALEAEHGPRDKIFASQLGTRLNGFLAGHGRFEELRDTLDTLALDAEMKDFIYGRWFDA